MFIYNKPNIHFNFTDFMYPCFPAVQAMGRLNYYKNMYKCFE